MTRFLDVTRDHRWAIGFRLGVLYGLRRSEVLALRWDDVDTAAKTLRVDQSVVAVNTGVAWSDAKNERSRRRIPIDDDTFRLLNPTPGRAGHLASPRRCRVGGQRADHRDAARAPGPPPLLRPCACADRRKGRPPTADVARFATTAATQMVAGATDIGQLRAIADILGHSPDMLMNTYAHAMPHSTAEVIALIGGPARF